MLTAFWVPILVGAAVNAIVAVGLYVTVLAGQLSVAHGALMGAGAYCASVLTTNFGWPFWAALSAGAVFAGVCGTLIAVPTARMPLFVQSLMTLAFGETLSIVAYNTQYIGGAAAFMGMPFDTTLVICVIALCVVIVAALVIDHSRLGLSARALRDDEGAARANGVSVVPIRTALFLLGGMIAGLGGGLSAHYTLVVDPSMLGFQASFSFLVFVLVGGSYTVWGGVLGAGLLTILPEALRFSSEYRYALYGIGIVFVVLVRPEGILTRRRFRSRTSLVGGGPISGNIGFVRRRSHGRGVPANSAGRGAT